MSATPRVRSGAFPHTPGTVAPRGAPPTPSPSPSPSPSSSFSERAPARSSPLPVAPHSDAPTPTTSQPLIPVTILDAPLQRRYAIALYIALLAWRLYDWALMEGDDSAESLWLFSKWAGIDLVFLFGLPELRIPWLELAQPVVIMLFVSHAVFDWMLMFHVPVPLISGLLGFVKVFFDSETAVSEHSVKVHNILHNASLIRGKQVINILPEGSARLNPQGTPFCLGGDHKVVTMPLYFNATVPILVELIRTDLDTNEAEIIKLSRSQIREIERLTKRHSLDGAPVAVQFDYPAKKTGAYRLGRALDEYKLEVQRRGPHTFVVPCPSASVVVSQSLERCLGDLSDLSLKVEGTPPLKIRYSRSINGKDHGFQFFQSLQPLGFSSPLVASSSLAVQDSDDISWARSQTVTVGLNESMNVGGDWQYSIDEVHDAFGNVAKYVPPLDDIDMRPKPKHLVQNFVVKERPKMHLQGCSMRKPLKVAKGKAIKLPVKYDVPGGRADDTAHSLTWLFSPIDSLTSSGDHGDVTSPGSYDAKHANDRPSVSAPGLYTLKSVSSGSCEGEIQEPSSCLLLNPLEPRLTLRSEEIPDNCAGHSVGLHVDLDLIGTPPFVVHYDVVTNGRTMKRKVDVPGMRYQMELIPRIAGDHEYIFKSIDDAVYRGQPLTGPEMVLKQSVKPAASASIIRPGKQVNACLEEEVEVECSLLGEAPFTLEYELFFENKRERFKVSDIDSHSYRFKTPVLGKGGEYTLALTNVQDKSGCRNSLQDELKISVRLGAPRAAFGLVDHKRSVMVVENSRAELPLRLQGDGPWRLRYRLDQPGTHEIMRTFRSGNDFLKVTGRGTYQLTSVRDDKCSGIIDPAASTFEVGWFPRPKLSLVETEGISHIGDKFVKQDICDGDVDSFEVNLDGKCDFELARRSRLIDMQVPRRSMATMRSVTRLFRDPPRSSTRSLRLLGPELLSRWTRHDLASARTSLLQSRTVSTTLTTSSRL